MSGVLNIFSSCAQDFQPNIWSVDSGIHSYDFLLKKTHLIANYHFESNNNDKKLFWKMTKPTKL